MKYLIISKLYAFVSIRHTCRRQHQCRIRKCIQSAFSLPLVPFNEVVIRSPLQY